MNMLSGVKSIDELADIVGQPRDRFRMQYSMATAMMKKHSHILQQHFLVTKDLWPYLRNAFGQFLLGLLKDNPPGRDR